MTGFSSLILTLNWEISSNQKIFLPGINPISFDFDSQGADWILLLSDKSEIFISNPSFINNLLNWSAINDSSSLAFISNNVAWLTLLNWITEANPKVSGFA